MKTIVEVTQKISALDYILFLLCTYYYDYYYEKDKKSMGYSCETGTQPSLHLSQQLWKSKVLKDIINLGWVAWLIPVFCLHKWKICLNEVKEKTTVDFDGKYFS